VTTRHEVAKRAGVSVSTVSRVFNSGYVAKETADRVIQASNEMSYQPHPIARALRKGATQQILCVTQSVANPFYSEVMRGVEEVVIQRGLVLSALSAHMVDCGFDPTMISGRYDGLILLSPNVAVGKLHSAIQELKVPVAVLWDWGTPTDYPHVGLDFAYAAGLGVAHLVDGNHREIGYLGYVPQSPEDANPRLQGFLRMCNQRNIPVDNRSIELVQGYGELEEGYLAMARLFRRRSDLTAVFASNDLLALGAMKWLRESGLTVPDQVSVVGFDDISFAALANPSLTTIHLPKQDIGRGLAQLMFDQIDGITSDLSRELTTRLVIRGSTRRISIKQTEHTVVSKGEK